MSLWPTRKLAIVDPDVMNPEHNTPCPIRYVPVPRLNPTLSPNRTQLAARVGLRGGRNRKYTLAEKLAARTIQGPSCWEVQGHQLPKGYVQISSGTPGKGNHVVVFAHRLAWELAHGRAVPAGLVVMHACDNPRCVNPAHLSVGTTRENCHDAIRKGRNNTFGVQKLNAEQVREIRTRVAAGERQKDVAARFGLARNSISGIVHRHTWAHLDPIGSPQAPLDRVFERVQAVQLPVRGVLHVGDSSRSSIPCHHNSITSVSR